MYCNLQFFPPEQYSRIGYFPLQYDGTNCSQNFIRIYADIPKNFTVASAYITLRHQPVTWNYYNSATATSTTNTVGSARNVQIYTDSLNARETINVDSELQSITSTPGTVTTKLGSSGKTFGNSQIETATSEELKEYLKTRKPYSF